MPDITVRIENLDHIKRAFRKAPELTVKELDKAIVKSIAKIEKDSKDNTPVRTGYLRSSHQSIFAPLKGVLTPTADYAIYVHEGTRFMKGRPFLANAVKSREEFVKDNFVKAVQNVFDKIAKESS